MRKDCFRLPVVATAAAALLGLPAAAHADISSLSLGVSPSTTAAGAHPDVTITESFGYSDSSDSVKDGTLHFPPGLLGNPQSTAKCAESDFKADACPAGTQVGEVSVDALVNGITPSTSPGSIHNLVPDATHPALLGIVVRPTAPGAGKIFLESPISLRTSSDFGIESPTNDQPDTVTVLGVPSPIQITKVTLTLYGNPPGGGQPFMSNPSSCKLATTSFDANSHEAPGNVSHASAAFTPTACDKLAFAPKVTATMGAPGATAKGSHAPFETTITQAVGESSQLSASVTLPASVSSGTNTVPVLCTADQLAAFACPDASRIGSAVIASPLLPAPVQGGVFALLRPAQLPGVGVEFGGTLPFVLAGSASLAPGGRLANGFTGLPDVPLTSFTLAIDGGPHGLLVANRNICTGPAPTVDAAFTAQSGASASLTSPVTVQGCGPAAAKRPRANASARGLSGNRSRLRVTVLKGAHPLRSIAVTLPRAIAVANPKKGVTAKGAAFRLSKKRIRLTRRGRLTLKLPSKGASRITATLAGGSIRATTRLKRELKNRRNARLGLVVRAVDTTGHATTLRVTFRGRR